jgi:hypothetical protein
VLSGHANISSMLDMESQKNNEFTRSWIFLQRTRTDITGLFPLAFRGEVDKFVL